MPFWKAVNVPSKLPGAKPWICSMLLDHLTVLVAMSHTQTPTRPASSATLMASGSRRELAARGEAPEEPDRACWSCWSGTACCIWPAAFFRGMAVRRGPEGHLRITAPLRKARSLAARCGPAPTVGSIKQENRAKVPWPALGDRSDRGFQLSDVIGFAEHRGVRMRAQAFVDMRAIVAGRNDDRQTLAQAAHLERERVTAPVRQADVDHRKRERLGSGHDLARGLCGGRLDRLIAELLEGVDRERRDQHLVLDQQDLANRAQYALLPESAPGGDRSELST